MKKRGLITSSTILAGLSLVQSQVAFAGWTGSMNGLGVGRSGANITSGYTGAFGSASNPAPIQNPGAAVTFYGTSNPPYLAQSPSPTGAASSTTSLIYGTAGYKWTATTYAAGGDRTDNSTLNSMVNVTPQQNAALSLTTEATYADNDPEHLHPLFLEVNGIATTGTALFIHGYDPTLVTPSNNSFSALSDTPSNPPNEFNLLFTGVGTFDPVTPSWDGVFHFQIAFPDGTNPNTFIVDIEGEALSSPDSGPLGFSFALTVVAMGFAHRRLNRSNA